MTASHWDIHGIILQAGLAWVIWGSFAMPRDLSPRTFLMGLGGALSAIGAGIIATAFAERTLDRERWIGGISVIGAGAVIFFLGAFWRRIAPKLGTGFSTFADGMARHSAYWTAIAALFSAGMALTFALDAKQAADKARNLTQQVASLRADLNCWAAPYHFNSEQSAKLTGYLKSRPPHEVYFAVAQNDNGASAFWSNIYKAVTDGGWKPKGPVYLPNMTEGLGVTITHENTGQDDSEIKAYTELQAAFQAAGFPFDHSGGAGVEPPFRQPTENAITIQIGPRRTDEHGPYCPQPISIDTYGPPTPR